MTKLPYNEVVLIIQGMGSGSPRQISADASRLPDVRKARGGRIQLD